MIVVYFGCFYPTQEHTRIHKKGIKKKKKKKKKEPFTQLIPSIQPVAVLGKNTEGQAKSKHPFPRPSLSFFFFFW